MASTLLNNIVSYWKLDGDSTDAVGTNNGTDTGITYGSAYGKINQGALFNGTTSKIDLGNVLGSVLVGAHTVAGWMFPTGGSYAELMGKTNVNSANPIDYYANLGTSNSFFAFLGNGSSGMYAYTANGVITQNAWNFVVVTYDGSGLSSGIKIYINGVAQVLTASGSITPTDSTNSLIIGSRSDAATTITGDEDEVGIWSRALTSTEVTELYNSGAGLQYPFTPTSVTTTQTLSATATATPALTNITNFILALTAVASATVNIIQNKVVNKIIAEIATATANTQKTISHIITTLGTATLALSISKIQGKIVAVLASATANIVKIKGGTIDMFVTASAVIGLKRQMSVTTSVQAISQSKLFKQMQAILTATATATATATQHRLITKIIGAITNATAGLKKGLILTKLIPLVATAIAVADPAISKVVSVIAVASVKVARTPALFIKTVAKAIGVIWQDFWFAKYKQQNDKYTDKYR